MRDVDDAPVPGSLVAALAVADANYLISPDFRPDCAICGECGTAN